MIGVSDVTSSFLSLPTEEGVAPDPFCLILQGRRCIEGVEAILEVGA